MTKYIALLRGINVGKIRIKMDDLKTAFESLGCTSVKTFLQTGNVVFESTKTLADLKPALEQALSETFHYKAYVLLYHFEELAAIIADYPMLQEQTHHAYVIFIENEAMVAELRDSAKTIETAFENVKLGNKVVYWKVKKGETLEAPLPDVFAKAKYKTAITTRNINTLEKMVGA